MEWEQLQGRAFALPETLQLDEVIEALNARLDDEQRRHLEQIQTAFGESVLEFTDKVLQNNLGIRKLGEVSSPVRAYILVDGAADAQLQAA
jgi:hypothetical protein